MQWDHEGPSFLAAFDKDTGAMRWKVPREELSSWSTPIVAEVDGRTQVIAAGAKRVKGYDFATGKVLWECGGLSEENVVATPVAGHGMAYDGHAQLRGLLSKFFKDPEVLVCEIPGSVRRFDVEP